MCVYLYLCMCVCIYIYIYIYIYICVFVCVFISLHVCRCVCDNLYAHINNDTPISKIIFSRFHDISSFSFPSRFFFFFFFFFFLIIPIPNLNLTVFVASWNIINWCNPSFKVVKADLIADASPILKHLSVSSFSSVSSSSFLLQSCFLHCSFNGRLLSPTFSSFSLLHCSHSGKSSKVK